METQKASQNKHKIQYLSEQLQINPCQSQILAQRSQAYKLNDDYLFAITDLSKAIYLDKSIVNYVQRANLYLQMGKYHYAIEDLQDAKIGMQQIQQLKQTNNNDLNKYNKKIFQDQQTTKTNIISDKQYNKTSDNKQSQNFIDLSQQIKLSNNSHLTKSMFSLEQQIDSKLEEFLSHSFAIQKLPKIKQIVDNYQLHKQQLSPQNKQQFQKSFKLLLKYQQKQSLKQQNQYTNKYQQQLARYQKLMELQMNMLKQQQTQINNLKNKMKYVNINFEKVFKQDIQSSTLSQQNKEKCKIYFHTVCSQMQKFYLGAKILKQFQTQKVSFSDLQGKPLSKSAQVIRKVFKAIDHYSQKMERVEQVIRQLPVLGTIFKIIKTASKGIQWLNQIKQKNQCHNILMIAATSITFHQFSTKLAYNLYKNYKMMITATQNEHYRHTQWQLVMKTYGKIKSKGIGGKIFSHILVQSEQQYVVQIGQVHASIIMLALSHRRFKYLTDEKNQQSGQTKSKNQQQCQQQKYEEFLAEVFETVNIIQERLKIKEQMLQNLGITHKEVTGGYLGSKCIIY